MTENCSNTLQVDSIKYENFAVTEEKLKINWKLNIRTCISYQ